MSGVLTNLHQTSHLAANCSPMSKDLNENFELKQFLLCLRENPTRADFLHSLNYLELLGMYSAGWIK